AGWPTRRREQWRYTDLEPLAAAELDWTPEPPSGSAREAALQLLEAPRFGDRTRQLVLLDGQLLRPVAALAPLEISETEDRWGEFEARFARTIAAASYPLAALNTAFLQRGLWLRLPPRASIAAPIHIVVASSARAGVATQPRIVIEAGEGAEATIVQHFVDCDASAGWVNGVTQLDLAAGSRLRLYRFQEHNQKRTHTSLLAAELAAGAELTAAYFDLGGKLVRNDVAVRLGGRGARTELTGLFLAGAAQHIDDHTTIQHAAGETVSNENFRGIIGERGRGVFNGRVVVERGCQRIDAKQSNDNLLLGEHAEIDTKPELEIYANDVKCSHGSTVGELDAEQLFYLRARGLDTPAARRLLTTAFAAVMLERVHDEALRAQATERVTAGLARLMES
ncbi:MAG TPA: Fe-S cluster assembly protein SufD, partial [Gammaproteobacteria bacterium]|nr:Fe-S cluster assembly protein SufD [Gammaproteobacteria bacterium]